MPLSIDNGMIISDLVVIPLTDHGYVEYQTVQPKELIWETNQRLVPEYSTYDLPQVSNGIPIPIAWCKRDATPVRLPKLGTRMYGIRDEYQYMI